MKATYLFVTLGIFFIQAISCMEQSDVERRVNQFNKLDPATKEIFRAKLNNPMFQYFLCRETDKTLIELSDIQQITFLRKTNKTSQNKNTEEINKLLNNSLSLACQFKDKFCSALHEIIFGANVNCKDQKNNPTITIAATYNNIYVCILLYLLGANLDATNSLNFTALHYSVHNKNYLGTKVLLQLGANPKIASLCGLTPLDQLKTQDNPSAEALRILFQEYS